MFGLFTLLSHFKQYIPGVTIMIDYRVNYKINNEMLNSLFADALSNHTWKDFSPILSHNLGHVCAIEGDILIGFINIAWDGGMHAFLLDPTVRLEFLRQDIGTHLVRHAIEFAWIKDPG